jgi:hypothetical protein
MTGKTKQAYERYVNALGVSDQDKVILLSYGELLYSSGQADAALEAGELIKRIYT